MRKLVGFHASIRCSPCLLRLLVYAHIGLYLHVCFQEVLECCIWLKVCRLTSDPKAKKGEEGVYTDVHTNVIQKLKKMLLETPFLEKPRYDHQHSIIGTVDTSPIGIRWAISKKKKMDRGMQFDLG